MITPVLHLLRRLPFLCGGHRRLAIENLALRQQLAVYKRTVPRPRLSTTDWPFRTCASPESGPAEGLSIAKTPADAQSGLSIDLIPMNSPCALGSPWRAHNRSRNDGAKPGQRVSPFFHPGLARDRMLRDRRSCIADRKSAGASDVLEAPVMIGGPSRTRTLDPLIKSHFGTCSIGHHAYFRRST